MQRRPLFRVDPILPAQAMMTWAILQPVQTHWRPATCAEVDCEAFAKGWSTLVDETTDLGARQAYYIRHDKTRTHRESRTELGTEFIFEPGQRCFAAGDHKVQLGRPQIFARRNGDWRKEHRGPVTRYDKAHQWVDDQASHLDKLAARHARG